MPGVGERGRLLLGALRVDPRVRQQEVQQARDEVRRVPDAHGDAAAERVRDDDVVLPVGHRELADADDETLAARLSAARTC